MTWKAGDDYKALSEDGPDRMTYYRPMEPFVVKFIQRASDEMFACSASNVSHEDMSKRMDDLVRETIREVGMNNVLCLLSALFRWQQLSNNLMIHTIDASDKYLHTFGIDLSAYVLGD